MTKTNSEREREAEQAAEPVRGELVSAETTSLTVAGPGGALAKVGELAAALPDADEDPTEGMVAFVLNAEHFQDWARLFESQGLAGLDGKAIRVHAIRGAVSAFQESRTGHFLVCDITIISTGENTVMTTGSEMTMAQLIVAHYRGWLPMDFEVVRKATETRKGRRPIHLRPLGRVAIAEGAADGAAD